MNQFQKISFAVYMILGLSYELNLMKNSWKVTKQNVAVVHQNAQEQCQLDQWEFCESPRYFNPALLFGETVVTFMWVSLETESIPHFVDSTTTWIWIHDSRLQGDKERASPSQGASTPEGFSHAMPESHLRTESSRRLTEKPCTRGSVFPSHCLQTAYAEQRVRRECSHALEDWQRALELQQWQAWIYQMTFGLAFVMWFGFALYKLDRYLQERSLKEGDGCCCCCCCKKDGCCFGKNGSCCSDTTQHADDPHRTDSCASCCCCCQRASEHPSGEETCCKCCTCCGCCCATSAHNSSAPKEEEQMPIRIQVV